MPTDIEQDSIQLYFRIIDTLRKLADLRFKVVNDYGISTSQFIVMCKVQENPHITQQELAKELQVTKGNISQMMKIMERDSLIQRHADGAAYRISLTAKAESMLEQIVPEQQTLIRSHMKVLSSEDNANLTLILDKLESNLKVL